MDTGWEEVLWWAFGVGIRNGTWSDKGGLKKSILQDVPASLQEILDHAKGKGVRLMAYVYPVIVGFNPSAARGGDGTQLGGKGGAGDDCGVPPLMHCSLHVSVTFL